MRAAPLQPSTLPRSTLILLELAFATRALRAVCEDESQAVAELGPEVARSLLHRLADLRAACHPLDLPLGRLRFGTEADAAHLFVNITDEYHLVLRANHTRPPRSDDGAIAWDRVSRIQLLRIEPSCE